MNKNFNHPLMYNNITSKDVSNLIHFLKNNKKEYSLNQLKLENLSQNGQNGWALSIAYLLIQVPQPIYLVCLLLKFFMEPVK